MKLKADGNHNPNNRRNIEPLKTIINGFYCLTEKDRRPKKDTKQGLHLAKRPLNLCMARQNNEVISGSEK